MSAKMMMLQLSLCLFATVTAQQAARGKDDTEEEAAPSTKSNQATGPIGAGIGFAVLFMGVVLYLCKKDYEEKKHEQAEKEKELKAMEGGEAKGTDAVSAETAAPEDGQVEIEVEIENRT